MKLPDSSSFSTLSPYYSPEAWGLEIVDSIDYSDGCYQFDLRVVWRDLETGKLFTGSDSGCSCPCPFENFKSENDFDVLDEYYYKSVLVPELESANENTTFDERQSFLDTVRRLL